VLDSNGEGIVELPYWFETLNTSFRYQLTAIGSPSAENTECVAGEVNPPWYPTLLSYEHHDSNRSKLYECASLVATQEER
jgi:hypothetical protein